MSLWVRPEQQREILVLITNRMLTSPGGAFSVWEETEKKTYRNLFCRPLSRYVMQLCISAIGILLTYQLVRTGTSSAGTMARQSGQVVTSPV